jgi:hypothetical protein
VKAPAIKRGLLLLALWLISSMVIYRFVGSGHGSLFPFAIFGSWPVLAVKYMAKLIKGFALPFIIALLPTYYFAIMRLATRLSANRKRGLWIIPGSIHLCGGLLFALTSDMMFPEKPLYGDSYDGYTIRFFLASYVISLGITIAWLAIDWRLAKRQTSAEE